MITDWTPNSDDTMEFAPTDDPRVFATLTLDPAPFTPDDCGTPTTITGSGWSIQPDAALHTCGCTNADETFDVDTVLDALGHYGETPQELGNPESLTVRYLRAFHGVLRVEFARSQVDQYAWVATFVTGAWCDHVGLAHDSTQVTDASILGDWRDYMDGEVYAVGYAVNVDRVMHDGLIVVDDLEITWDYGGVYGRENAESMALESAVAEADLPDLLPLG